MVDIYAHVMPTRGTDAARILGDAIPARVREPATTLAPPDAPSGTRVRTLYSV